MKQCLLALLVQIGLRVARYGGWVPTPPCALPHLSPCTLSHLPPCTLPHLPADEQVELARRIVQDIAIRFPEAPGPVKAREALRVLLNLRPDARERDLNLLIELALQ